MAADPQTLFPGKYFISTVLGSLDTKTEMSGALRRRYLMRAGMAGIIIGVFYSASFAVASAFAVVGDGQLSQVGKIAGALTFAWALVFIYYTRSELLTSNMMIVSVGLYHRRIRWSRAMRLLGLCLFGNFLGGLLVAVLVRFSSILDGAAGVQAQAALDHKMEFITAGASGWGDLFVRAILCNFLINIAMLVVYNGYIKEDLMKALVMVVAVFLFAYLGFEHSVANTVLFTIAGLDGGLPLGEALANVGLALAGNFVGGGLLIGWYYSYCNDDRKYVAAS